MGISLSKRGQILLEQKLNLVHTAEPTDINSNTVIYKIVLSYVW
jgi:hypothetical protein